MLGYVNFDRSATILHLEIALYERASDDKRRSVCLNAVNNRTTSRTTTHNTFTKRGNVLGL